MLLSLLTHYAYFANIAALRAVYMRDAIYYVIHRIFNNNL